MNKFIKAIVDNPVAPNLLMMLLLIGGFLSINFKIRKDVFPELSPSFINITTVYLGASPLEVEESVVSKIENKIQSEKGIKEIRSFSYEGYGVVSVEAKTSYDINKLLDDIKIQVDSINSFPLESEKPIVTALDPVQPVINLVLSGNTDYTILKEFSKQIKDELLTSNFISQVSIIGDKNYEISIEVDPKILNKYDLNFNEIKTAINQYSLNLPLGNIKTSKNNYSIRSNSQKYNAQDFKNIPIKIDNGSILRLSDIAVIKDQLEENDLKSRFNGLPAFNISIKRVGDEDAITITNYVKKYLESKVKELPENISIDIWDDRSLLIKSRISLLVNNGIIGIILVFLILALFMEFSLAFWVTLGIPISFMGTFLVMPFFGMTINLLSLFGFILVLGIVVDDAIIVGEAIFAEREKGHSAKDAAVKGTSKILLSVVFSILTTIAAFGTFFAIPGSFGTIFQVISFVVIVTLIFSLIESLIILPVHLKTVRNTKSKQPNFIANYWEKLSVPFNSFFYNLRDWYLLKIKIIISYRYISLVTLVCSLFLILSLVINGWIKFSFFPQVDADFVSSDISYFAGTSINQTEKGVNILENKAIELKRELNSKYNSSVIKNIYTIFGTQPFKGQQSERGGGSSQNDSPEVAEVVIELSPSEERKISAKEISNIWKSKTTDILNVKELIFSSALFSSGKAVDLEFSSKSLDSLNTAIALTKEYLQKISGIENVSDSLLTGKKEINIKLNSRGESLGLTNSDLALSIRSAFYGLEVQKIQRLDEEVKVMLRYPLADRKKVSTIDLMEITLKNGLKVPFNSVASFSFDDSYSDIQRINRRRSASISADLNPKLNTSANVIADIKKDLIPKIKKIDSSIKVSFAGSEKEQSETISGLIFGFMFSLIIIYSLIAIPLKSYSQPLIIMISIPFGLIGALLGHLLIGINVTILSLFGIIALSGVVINDGLVLVSYINDERSKGTALIDAIINGTKQRFRAVIITSITTFAGLTPIIFEKSVQAQFLVPIAVSLGFGVLFATVITLVLVPIMYLVLNDIKRFLNSIFRNIN